MKDHNRQKFWQILFPLILFVLIILTVAVLMIIQTNGISAYPIGLKYANISMIFLILVAILPILLFLAILSAFIYGLIKLLNITPLYSKIAQSYVYLAATKIIIGADVLVKPVLVIKSILAGVNKSITMLQKSLSKIYSGTPNMEETNQQQIARN